MIVEAKQGEENCDMMITCRLSPCLYLSLQTCRFYVYNFLGTISTQYQVVIFPYHHFIFYSYAQTLEGFWKPFVEWYTKSQIRIVARQKEQHSLYTWFYCDHHALAQPDVQGQQKARQTV